MPCRSDPERVCDRHGLPEDLTAITGSSRASRRRTRGHHLAEGSKSRRPPGHGDTRRPGTACRLPPGFRPVHAKGVMCAGRSTPGRDAVTLTRAPHASRDSTPVIVRFSNAAGLPTIPDNAPSGAGPRGIAIRFTLGPHVHTDIIGHSYDGFPTRTGAEFLELNRAVLASGPEAAKPTPIEVFLSTHPKALAFVQPPKPIPTSFARDAFVALTAFRFTNKD